MGQSCSLSPDGLGGMEESGTKNRPLSLDSGSWWLLGPWPGRPERRWSAGRVRNGSLRSASANVVILSFSQPSGCLGSHRPTATLQMQPDTPVSHDSDGRVTPTCFYIPFNELIPTPLCSFRCMLPGCSVASTLIPSSPHIVCWLMLKILILILRIWVWLVTQPHIKDLFGQRTYKRKLCW